MMFSLRRLSQITNRPEQTQIALGVIAVIALVFGFWQLKHAIILPIGLGEGLTEAPAASEQTVSEESLRLQAQDTDQDGLSDYDELYVYGTSPYLTDSDSDGYSDGTEIDSGNDPNCPPDGNCRPVVINTGSGEAAAVIPTAAEIRDLLRSAGVTEEQLANYDDEELVQIYREVSGEQIVGATGTGTSETTGQLVLTPEQKQLIKQMTGAELRQFLINGGVNPTALENIDDATLKVLVEQELKL